MIKTKRFEKLRRIAGKKLIGIAFILMGAAIILQLFVRPNIIQVCEYNTKSAMLRIIDDAINSRLIALTGETDYSSLVCVRYDSHGKVSSIESDVAAINMIKTDMLTQINNRLKASAVEEVCLSVGTLSGIAAFHGMGPEVIMRVEPKGYADAEFISQFTDAGINQTRHRIIMRTSVSVTAFIPFYSVETKVSGDFLIAETIIVGDIPESYTHVISDNEDVIDKIFDFEAQ